MTNLELLNPVTPPVSNPSETRILSYRTRFRFDKYILNLIHHVCDPTNFQGRNRMPPFLLS